MFRLDIDCFVDADFVILWGYEDKQDPLYDKSRTGYVIFFADCSVLSKWYGIKYHWFGSKLKPNSIDIIKIASADQRADFCTTSRKV
jgi:hypothetical protein